MLTNKRGSVDWLCPRSRELLIGYIKQGSVPTMDGNLSEVLWRVSCELFAAPCWKWARLTA